MRSVKINISFVLRLNIPLNPIFGPEKSIRMEVIIKMMTISFITKVAWLRVWNSMVAQMNSKAVVIHWWGVSSYFYNINLARLRNFSIWHSTVYVLFWEQPNGRPKPFTFWYLGVDLHFTILKIKCVFGFDSSGLNRKKNWALLLLSGISLKEASNFLRPTWVCVSIQI